MEHQSKDYEERLKQITNFPEKFGHELETSSDYFNAIQQSVNYIKKKFNENSFDVAVVLGSGHKSLAYSLDDKQILQYVEIPNFPIPTSIGHGRELVYGKVHGKRVLAFTGRIHCFEGYRSFYHNFLGLIAAFSGCQLLISTNSCGSMLPHLQIGDFILISDHLNESHRPFMNAPLLDDRFRSQNLLNYIFQANKCHKPEMIALAKDCAKEVGIDLMDGCYAYWPLPQFESVAEIQFTMECGAQVTGASTIPEQLSAHMMGIKNVAFAAVTNPATGFGDISHSGEANLEYAKKAHDGLIRTIFKIIERFQLSSEKWQLDNHLLTSGNHLSLKGTLVENMDEVVDKILSQIQKWIGNTKLSRALWFMTNQTFSQFLANQRKEFSDSFYFINLSDIVPLRTRSYDEAQIILLNHKDEQWLVLKQPYLEGMLPYEYSVILKVFQKLGIPFINVYLESASVSSEELKGTVQPIKFYFNKRFYKHTESCCDLSPTEIPDFINPQNSNDLSLFKTLFGAEGCMLPTKSELKMAEKGNFDLYTITNLSFLDIAIHMGMKPNVFAVCMNDLSNRKEEIPQFQNFQLFAGGELSQEHKEQQNQEKCKSCEEVKTEFLFDAEFDLKHDKEIIYDVSNRLKEVVGIVDNVVVFEKETFEILISDYKDSFKVEKSVKLHLKDYRNGKSVIILKVNQNGHSLLLVSDHLSYQSHVPFQTLLLSIRVCVIGAESKNFIVCPHVWNLNWEKNQEKLKAGDLFVVTDHANMSACSPGIGPNIEEYGPRFYDIQNMYGKTLTNSFKKILSSSEGKIKYCEGDVFWINNSTIPSLTHTNLAKGLSNSRVCFKGVIKNGVNELMAVQHRISKSPYPLQSGMLGIVTDSVIKSQQKHEAYRIGVKHLFDTVCESLNALSQAKSE